MAQGKKHIPTDEDRKLVEAMAGYGVPLPQIGALIQDGIDEDTLHKWYKKEIQQGKAKANAEVGQTLFQKAVGGDTTAAIWWSKTQMRWSETVNHNIEESPEPKQIIFTVRDARLDANAEPPTE